MQTIDPGVKIKDLSRFPLLVHLIQFKISRGQGARSLIPRVPYAVQQQHPVEVNNSTSEILCLSINNSSCSYKTNVLTFFENSLLKTLKKSSTSVKIINYKQWNIISKYLANVNT